MSEAAKHMPGPWKVSEYVRGGGVVRHIVQVETGKRIAEASGHSQKAISEANARLIAAAPDMLAALKQVEAEMRAGFGSSFGETREQIRRAISRAESTPLPADRKE